MKLIKDFAGLDGFYWWFGVVENRQDPEKLGRCRVRIYGAHNSSFSDIPTEDLPWAHPVHSLNNQMFSTPKEGDMVFGFFVDGHFAQQPVIMGIIPIKPSQIPNGENGFNDPRTPEELALAPKKPRGISYGNNDGTGARVIEQVDGFETLRHPYDSIDYPTNSDLARNERIKGSFIQSRRDSLIGVKGAFGTSWKEPFPAYAAKYPYNKVLETESGHIQEFDDTPGAERIHTAHRSGTFEEIYPSGTKVEKIVKNNYEIILADDHLYVAGKVNITVGSHANIKVEGDINLEGRGDLTAGIAGNMNFSVGGDFKLKAKTVAMETEFDYNVKSTGAIKLGTEGGLHLSTQKLKFLSDNGLSIITDGELFLSGADIILQAGKTVGVIAPVSFNVMSPVSNMGLMLKANFTNLKAYGVDSHGDSHILSVGLGLSVPLVPIPLPTNYLVYPPKSSFLGDAPTFGDPTLSPRFKETTPVDTAAFSMGGTTSDPNSIDLFIMKQIENGIYTQEQIDEGVEIAKKPIASDPNPTKNKSTTIVVNNRCEDVKNMTDIDNSLLISKYFTIADFTIKTPAGKAPLKGQRGYTKNDIACNMKVLAVNCLDKIKEKYPTMKIVSGFRYIDETSNGESQHEIGQAVDIQFDALNNNPGGYYDIALWVKDNIPYDQLILEYRTTGSRSPWIHISYNIEGNRSITVKNKVTTTMNHKTVDSKLVKLDVTTKKITPVATSIVTDGNTTTETKPLYDADGKLTNVQIIRTTDPVNGNMTEEVTTNDGEVEIITTTTIGSNGQIIGTPTVSRNKFDSDDPRDGPGGILAKLIAGYAAIMNVEPNILAGLFRDATNPIIKKVEGYGNQLGNIATQMETLVSNVKDIGCKIYGQYSKFVGKLRRELVTIKDAAKTLEDKTEKATNTKFTFGGVVHAAAKLARKELEKKIEQLEYSLLSSWDALVCKLKMFWPNELKALGEEMDKFYDRLYGVYDKLVAQRAKKYRKLKDSIKTRTYTWCDDAGVASSGNANSDTDRTRKGCKE